MSKKSISDDVSGPFREDGLDHPVGVAWLVGAVAIGHQHDRSIDGRDPLTDGLALATA